MSASDFDSAATAGAVPLQLPHWQQQQQQHVRRLVRVRPTIRQRVCGDMTGREQWGFAAVVCLMVALNASLANYWIQEYWEAPLISEVGHIEVEDFPAFAIRVSAGDRSVQLNVSSCRWVSDAHEQRPLQGCESVTPASARPGEATDGIWLILVNGTFHRRRGDGKRSGSLVVDVDMVSAGQHPVNLRVIDANRPWLHDSVRKTIHRLGREYVIGLSATQLQLAPAHPDAPDADYSDHGANQYAFTYEQGGDAGSGRNVSVGARTVSFYFSKSMVDFSVQTNRQRYAIGWRSVLSNMLAVINGSLTLVFCLFPVKARAWHRRVFRWGSDHNELGPAEAAATVAAAAVAAAATAPATTTAATQQRFAGRARVPPGEALLLVNGDHTGTGLAHPSAAWHDSVHFDHGDAQRRSPQGRD